MNKDKHRVYYNNDKSKTYLCLQNRIYEFKSCDYKSTLLVLRKCGLSWDGSHGYVSVLPQTKSLTFEELINLKNTFHRSTWNAIQKYMFEKMV